MTTRQALLAAAALLLGMAGAAPAQESYRFTLE